MYQLKGAAKVKPYSYFLFESICAITLDRHVKLGFQQFLIAWNLISSFVSLSSWDDTEKQDTIEFPWNYQFL